MNYEDIDTEILSYLAWNGEQKTRRILDYLRDEFCDGYQMFSRSTLWRHLENLKKNGLIRKRITCDGRGLAYWSLVGGKE
jgi:DNA-binding Lrp family transcriptional regulator